MPVTQWPPHTALVRVRHGKRPIMYEGSAQPLLQSTTQSSIDGSPSQALMALLDLTSCRLAAEPRFGVAFRAPRPPHKNRASGIGAKSFFFGHAKPAPAGALMASRHRPTV